MYFTDSFYPTIQFEEPATKARALMRDLGLRILPVVDASLHLYGIVRRENVLLITSTRSNALVKDIMDYPTITFKPEEDALNSFRVMLEFDEWYVPVVKDLRNNYVGMFSLDSLIRYLLKSEHRVLELYVKDVMSSNVEYVYPEDHISKLWRKMMQLRYSGFPVIKGRERVVVGIITQHDLLKKGYTRIELESPSGPKYGPRVREVMTSPPITVRPTSKLREVVIKMVKSNIGRLPVVDEDMRLVGIVDRSDVCRAFLNIEL